MNFENGLPFRAVSSEREMDGEGGQVLGLSHSAILYGHPVLCSSMVTDGR